MAHLCSALLPCRRCADHGVGSLVRIHARTPWASVHAAPGRLAFLGAEVWPLSSTGNHTLWWVFHLGSQGNRFGNLFPVSMVLSQPFPVLFHPVNTSVCPLFITSYVQLGVEDLQSASAVPSLTLGKPSAQALRGGDSALSTMTSRPTVAGSFHGTPSPWPETETLPLCPSLSL